MTLLSIGELATQTGLPVRTIRFYSDEGVVPAAERSEAGYRLYGPDAPARLGLVGTLRELGIDLATIRRVLERGSPRCGRPSALRRLTGGRGNLVFYAKEPIGCRHAVDLVPAAGGPAGQPAERSRRPAPPPPPPSAVRRSRRAANRRSARPAGAAD